mmetsp:Transcript_5179/g.13174  ORF Transcript_5179/g.13174 Transcript_5179/m.13174 type:complete len:237 (+) Transcript_5179:379-1089(+)
MLSRRALPPLSPAPAPPTNRTETIVLPPGGSAAASLSSTSPAAFTSHTTSRLTDPLAVNFTAFQQKLVSTCWIRPTSPMSCRLLRMGDTLVLRISPFSCAADLTCRNTLWITRSTEKLALRSSSLPSSSLFRSRMSSTVRRSWSVHARVVRTRSSTSFMGSSIMFTAPVLPNAMVLASCSVGSSSSMASTDARMPLTGLRISCDMNAICRDLASAAASAVRLSSSNEAVASLCSLT